MFRIKWYKNGDTEIKNGEEYTVETSEIQTKIMKLMHKQLKRDKMQITETDDNGYIVYMSPEERNRLQVYKAPVFLKDAIQLPNNGGIMILAENF